jgi:hypothetical protein
MTLSVIRTYGVNSRYRYSLHRDGMFVRKILSDTEARFANILPDMTMKLAGTAAKSVRPNLKIRTHIS